MASCSPSLESTEDKISDEPESIGVDPLESNDPRGNPNSILPDTKLDTNSFTIKEEKIGEPVSSTQSVVTTSSSAISSTIAPMTAVFTESLSEMVEVKMESSTSTVKEELVVDVNNKDVDSDINARNNLLDCKSKSGENSSSTTSSVKEDGHKDTTGIVESEPEKEKDAAEISSGKNLFSTEGNGDFEGLFSDYPDWHVENPQVDVGGDTMEDDLMPGDANLSDIDEYQSTEVTYNDGDGINPLDERDSIADPLFEVEEANLVLAEYENEKQKRDSEDQKDERENNPCDIPTEGNNNSDSREEKENVVDSNDIIFSDNQTNEVDPTKTE